MADELFTREPLDMNPENTSGWKTTLDKIIVRIRKTKETSAGGIHIPEEARTKEENFDNIGLVVDMGPHTYSGVKPECAVGDVVMLDRYAGQLFDGDDGHKYRLVSDRMILCVKK